MNVPERLATIETKIDQILVSQAEQIRQQLLTNGRLRALEKWRTIVVTAVTVLALTRPDWAMNGIQAIAKVLAKV